MTKKISIIFFFVNFIVVFSTIMRYINSRLVNLDKKLSTKYTSFYYKLPAVLLFLFVTLNPVFSENMYTGVQILLGVISEEQDIETKMDTLIYNLLVFELERYGLITEKAQFEENESFELILSLESDSGLAVICSYTTNGKRVFLDIELYDIRTMITIASSTMSTDLDLSFDKAIYSAVSDLINSADEDLKKRVVNMNYKDVTTDKENKPEKVTETELPVINNGSKGGMEAFLNAGIAMGVGESRNFLPEPGLSMEFSGNYWFDTNFGFLGIGGQASANLYPSATSEGSASLIMFPIGVILSWSTSSDRFLSALIQTGAGPAIAVLTFEGTDPLTKIVSYVSGGVLLSFNFRKRMSLGLKTVYHIYFEDTGMITTFAPSIFASFRSWN